MHEGMRACQAVCYLSELFIQTAHTHLTLGMCTNTIMFIFLREVV